MAERVVVQSRLGREGLRPAAAPQDTFEAPPKDSKLLSLAESLKDFAPAVGGVMSAVEQNRKEQAQKQEVERKEDERQAAQLSAFNMGLELEKHLAENLAGETDPQKVNEAATAFMEKWEVERGTGDANFDLRTWRQQAEAVRQRVTGQAADRANIERKKKVEQEFGALIGAAVTGEINWTKPEGREERLKGAISALRERGFAMGIQGSRLNEMIFESISQLGVAQGNPQLVEMLYNVPTGPDGKSTLGSIPEYQYKIDQAYLQAHRRAATQDELKDTTKKERGSAILGEANKRFIEAMRGNSDPTSVPLDDLLEQMNGVDATRVDEILNMRQTFSLGFKRQTLPVIEEDLVRRIFDPEEKMTLDQLYRQFESGGIGKDSYLRMRTIIEKRDHVRKTSSTNPDTLLNVGLRIVGERVDAMGVDADEGREIKGQLKTKLRSQFYSWLSTEEGMKATAEQRRAQARLIAETLTENAPTAR